MSAVSQNGCMKRPERKHEMSQTMKTSVLEIDITTGKFTPRESNYNGPITQKAWRGINKRFLDASGAGKFYPLGPEDAYQSAVLEAEKAAAKIANGLALEKKTTPETYEIAAAKLTLLNHGIRDVTPARNLYRAIESKTMGRGAVGEDGFDVDNHNGADDCPDKAMCDISGETCEESAPAGTPSTAQALADGLRSGTPMHVRAERALNHLSELCERILATDRKMGETVVLAFAAYIVCDGNFVEACRLAHISKDRWYRDWPLWCRWARAAAREYGKEHANG